MRRLNSGKGMHSIETPNQLTKLDKPREDNPGFTQIYHHPLDQQINFYFTES